MSAVCHLDPVPNETICDVLDGCCMDDIVSFALTSSRFYSLVKTVRSVWLNASDKIMLPLPTGHTVTTIPNDLIFSLALRAISIAKALGEDVAVSKRFSHKDLGDLAGARVPLPGGRWIIYEHRDGFGTHESNGIQGIDQVLIAEDSGTQVTAETLGNGIVRCMRSEKYYYHPVLFPETISITDVHFPLDAKDRPSLVAASSWFIRGPHHVCDLYNSWILDISGDQREVLCLVDTVRRHGLQMTPDEYNRQGRRLYSFSKAKFHPQVAKIVVTVMLYAEEGDEERTEIWLVDLPYFVAHPNRPEKIAESSMIAWTPVKFSITHRYLVPYELPMEPPLEVIGGIPESYVYITEVRIPPPRMIYGSDLIVALCLSPENEFLPVSLVYLEEGWMPTVPKDWTLATKPISRDVIAIAFTTPVGRALKQIHLKIPGFGTLWKRFELGKFDPVYGQVHLTVIGRSLTGFEDPYFVVQY
ncbi:hypothetical protein SISNIDRAFT_498426 [Sistotremastrum niveocremeum HHB9708]|uniref:F-box domain-containing protein n=1 Tax=Sistotremastrum niveocremeum HHB9708 TaxID=1314777 RepID=A0A164NBJ6_9AGAM|nr:hypothetical protein SISNIDRAFT_498426 [Sistotremastrum niveocremeum HHB9708]